MSNYCYRNPLFLLVHHGDWRWWWLTTIITSTWLSDSNKPKYQKSFSKCTKYFTNAASATITTNHCHHHTDRRLLMYYHSNWKLITTCHFIIALSDMVKWEWNSAYHHQFIVAHSHATHLPINQPKSLMNNKLLPANWLSPKQRKRDHYFLLRCS